MSIFSGDKPDITPAQIKAAIIACIPIIANLLHVFGVYDLSKEQEDALKQTAALAAGFGGVLALADSYLRGARNKAAAIAKAGSTVNVTASAPADPSTLVDTEVDDTTDLPSDDVEFADTASAPAPTDEVPESAVHPDVPA
jgi:hypothetical protein